MRGKYERKRCAKAQKVYDSAMDNLKAAKRSRAKDRQEKVAEAEKAVMNAINFRVKM